MLTFVAVATAAIIACAVIAACSDLASRTIPNWTCGAILLVSLSLQAIEGHLALSLAAATMLFAVTFILWRLGCIGGGDVKLISSLGLAVQPGAVFALVLFTSLWGGVLALVYIALRHLPRRGNGNRPTKVASRILRAEHWRVRRGAPLPYGIAITAGAVSVFLVS